MDGLIAPPDGDRDRGSITIAISWTALVLASLVVSLRLYARFKKRALGFDDWSMLLSVVRRSVPKRERERSA